MQKNIVCLKTIHASQVHSTVIYWLLSCIPLSSQLQAHTHACTHVRLLECQSYTTASHRRFLIVSTCVYVCVRACVRVCYVCCARECVCVTMKKKCQTNAASTTSDTGNTSSKQQQAQRKQKYNKRKRPVSSVDHCHPYRRIKRSSY